MEHLGEADILLFNDCFWIKRYRISCTVVCGAF